MSADICEFALKWLEKKIEKDAAAGRAKAELDADQEVNSFLTPDEDIALTEAEIDNIYSFPTKEVVSLLMHRCRVEIAKKDHLSVALTLLQSQGIIFRHQAFTQYQRRFSANEKSSTEEMETSVDAELRHVLLFRNSKEERANILSSVRELPKAWRVVQLSIDPRFRESLRFKSRPGDKSFTEANFGLFVIAIDGGSVEPDAISVYPVEAVENEENPTILTEFQDIIECHKNVFMVEKNRDKTKLEIEVLKERTDERLESLLATMENKWLGFAKVFFLGQPVAQERVNFLREKVDFLESKYFKSDPDFLVSGRRKLLERLLDGSAILSKKDISQGLKFCCGSNPLMETLLESFQMFSVALKSIPSKRQAIIIILDREIQTLPWEAMPSFQNAYQPQPFTRVPSILFLKALLTEHTKKPTTTTTVSKDVEATSIRSDRIFYVLNPDKDLALTQKRLKPQFERLSLKEGVVGEQPTLEQVKSVLSEWDGFMYCGHGARLKNVPVEEIEQLHVQAVSLLFGCNSGRMQRHGRQLDPLGVVSSYLIATTPRLLGFLWVITDKGVDDWTIKFLEHWIGNGPGQHEADFVQAVANLRSAFDRVVNSAATVVYGLPEIPPSD